MATSGIYYLNAPSLSSATSAYTDAALTTLAPNGFYSDGTNVRELVSGIFTNNSSLCPACLNPCSSTPININDTGTKIYYVNQNVGDTVLDTGAIIVEVSFNGNEYPVGLVFTYNAISYNKFSCQNFGIVEPVFNPFASPIVYIGNSLYDCSISGSTYNASIYNYDVVNNVFIDSGSITTMTVVSSQVALSPSSPGKFIMVIPKPSSTPSILYYISSILCPSTVNVDITVKCPTALPVFTSTEPCALSLDTCLLPTVQTYYSADVNGTTSSGGYLGLYDWVFYDSFGQNILPDGFYRSPSVQFPDEWFEVQDGVIVSFGSGCASIPQKNITYEVQNAINGACAANVDDLRLKVSQPPVAPYIDASAYSTGSNAVPEGLTHAQLILTWNGSVTGCGQVRMVIEKDSVIIASKTLTPSGVEYLDVDFILNADCNIYAYVTLL